MKFVSEKHFNLIPIGNIVFTFNKANTRNPNQIWVASLNILHDTDAPISKETEKALLKEMKKAKSDLLTDGVDFYTTRGAKITQIKHPRFNEVMNELSAEDKQKIHTLRFG